MDNIIYAEHGKIAYITLNKPNKHNALNIESIKELRSCINQANNSNHIRAIILKANGKSFCAGADLNWLHESDGNTHGQNVQEAKELSDMLASIAESSKVTIAYAHGKVLGGGLGIISACDIVVADPHTICCAPEARIGMAPAIIAPYVASKIGNDKAKFLFLTTINIAAAEAKKIGIVNEVIQHNKFDKHELDLLEHINKTAPNAIKIIKDMMRSLSSTCDSKIAKRQYELMATVRASDEAKHGIGSFLKKQTIKWD